MTELDKLIEEFKITLSKFEVIASRMEARMGLDPIRLPRFPPLPEGYSRWVYRGKGWKSKERVRFACIALDDLYWVTFPVGCTVGDEKAHYIEAIKDPR
jgi:hypothetical protein